MNFVISGKRGPDPEKHQRLVSRDAGLQIQGCKRQVVAVEISLLSRIYLGGRLPLMAHALRRAAVSSSFFIFQPDNSLARPLG